MFENTLAPATKKLLEKLNSVVWLKNFYLAGGTALALHYGHQQSIDLDWFAEKTISLPHLLKNITAIAPFEILNQEENTLEGILEKVKISFMTYPYPLLKKPLRYDHVSLAAPLDIALMKLNAIAGRNTKKDFIDLYVFLEKENMKLNHLLDYLEKKFPKTSFDRYHLYKSLIYFTDADQEAMPRMLIPLEWKKVKSFFTKEVKKLP